MRVFLLAHHSNKRVNEKNSVSAIAPGGDLPFDRAIRNAERPFETVLRDRRTNSRRRDDEDDEGVVCGKSLGKPGG